MRGGRFRHPDRSRTKLGLGPASICRRKARGSGCARWKADRPRRPRRQVKPFGVGVLWVSRIACSTAPCAYSATSFSTNGESSARLYGGFSQTLPNHGRSSPLSAAVKNVDAWIVCCAIPCEAGSRSITPRAARASSTQSGRGEPFILAGVFRLQIARRAGRHAFDARFGVLDPNLEFVDRQRGQFLPVARIGSW